MDPASQSGIFPDHYCLCPGESPYLKMKQILPAVTLAALLFASCAGRPGKRILTIPETPAATRSRDTYIITDYKNKASGESIPEWVELWLNSGIHEIEALDAYQDRYVYVSWNEGNSFNALSQWTKGFSTELDFPRMAAGRIDARFSASIPFPDEEYGAFYDTLIRTASDTLWMGAVREDDFWIRREFPAKSAEDESSASLTSETGQPDLSGSFFPGMETGQSTQPPGETWEFMILVSIKKVLFASQLEDIFKKLDPRPMPSREQINAVNKVKERFFDGF